MFVIVNTIKLLVCTKQSYNQRKMENRKKKLYSTNKMIINTYFNLRLCIYTGQLMSCTDRSRFNFNGGIDRKYILTEMVNKLYAKFYENFNNKLTDLKTSKEQ